MDVQLIDFPALSAKLAGRSRSSIDRDVKEGRLPKPLKMGQRNYWNVADVDAHLAKMLSDQTAESAI